MAENVKYYINGKQTANITLTDSDSTNSIDIQILNESAPAPTDFIFKQFVKVTEESKWTEDIKNAVDEKGAIAFLPFKDTGTGKNQIYAQGSYFGGGLDSSDVDSSAASFQDNTGKTMILTVGDDGKLRFITYQKITVSTAGSGAADVEWDTTPQQITLKCTASKTIDESGGIPQWKVNSDASSSTVPSSTSLDSGKKVCTATVTPKKNTPNKWSIVVKEKDGDPSNGNTKRTAQGDVSYTFNKIKPYGYFFSTNEELNSSNVTANTGDGFNTLTISGSGTHSTVTIPAATANPSNKPSKIVTGAALPNVSSTMYVFVPGSSAPSDGWYIKQNGGAFSMVTCPALNVGTFKAYNGGAKTYTLLKIDATIDASATVELNVNNK